MTNVQLFNVGVLVFQSTIFSCLMCYYVYRTSKDNLQLLDWVKSVIDSKEQILKIYLENKYRNENFESKGN